VLIHTLTARLSFKDFRLLTDAFLQGDRVCGGYTAMSAFGTKRTSRSRSLMSAFGGKADISRNIPNVCL
jgi:hypothetical protein